MEWRTFREATWGSEEKVRQETDDLLESEDAGELLPRCWDATWEAVEALYSYATCDTYCPGDGDHTFRLIAGRAVNLALGALTNLRSGHYDSVLLIVRGLGELGNVAAALMVAPEAMEEFKKGRSLRGDEFKILNAAGQEPFVSGRRYGLLSKRAVHPAFDSIVQTHSPGVSLVGSHLQGYGFALGLNELAIALASFVVLGDDVSISKAEAKAIAASVRLIADSIGGVAIDNLPPGLMHPHPENRWRTDDSSE